MLLRLRVKGFKSLRDVDIQFGPLTCLVGANGAGKSNIFDAIQFLRNLASGLDIQHAADAVRRPVSGHFGPLELFWNEDQDSQMSFEADMLVPGEVTDDFGRPAEPTTTLLKYEVAFRYAGEPKPRLELVHEHLAHLKKGDAKDVIGFRHAKAFRDTAVQGKRFGVAFISSEKGKDHDGIVVNLHQDGGSRGQPVPAGSSPRTVLGGTNGMEYPTVLAARREMASWLSFQLEPSSLRQPDDFGVRDRVDEHGAHIAATLYRLGRSAGDHDAVYAEAANRLAQLVSGVKAVRVHKDEVRQQYSTEVRLRDSELWHGPRALSDGTLRFLALVTMQMDSQSSRVLCMEEPENGIHPSRTPVLITLLRDYAVEPSLPVEPENPLRQVILNSHSPEVLKQLDATEVLFVESASTKRSHETVVRAVDTDDNWRVMQYVVPIHALEAVIGGAPFCMDLESRQLKLVFGTAR